MNNLTRISTLFQIVLYDFLRKNHKRKSVDSGLRDAIDWLIRAQDISPNDGVSEGYHLKHGWLPSYPETTGYIIETFFDCAVIFNEPILKERALRMANWLISIQYEDGAIPDSYFKKKMVFDTGQVVFGFVRAFEETGEQKYRDAAVKAGDWLTDVQEQDGTWRNFSVGNIPHTYYTRVAWSLTRLHKITSNDKYIESCSRNVDWALAQQQDNGWFNNASFMLDKHVHPYTHTIAYTIRGILESGVYLKRDDFIRSARKSMDSLLAVLPDSGRFSGKYNKKWHGDSRFSCLTGDAQLAIIFFKLYSLTAKRKYLNAGRTINRYLLSIQEKRIKRQDIYGALAGSNPIWGEYIHFMYPNWAVKFLIDSILLEKKLIL